MIVDTTNFNSNSSTWHVRDPPKARAFTIYPTPTSGARMISRQKEDGSMSTTLEVDTWRTWVSLICGIPKNVKHLAMGRKMDANESLELSKLADDLSDFEFILERAKIAPTPKTTSKREFYPLKSHNTFEINGMSIPYPLIGIVRVWLAAHGLGSTSFETLTLGFVLDASDVAAKIDTLMWSIDSFSSPTIIGKEASTFIEQQREPLNISQLLLLDLKPSIKNLACVLSRTEDGALVPQLWDFFWATAEKNVEIQKWWKECDKRCADPIPIPNLEEDVQTHRMPFSDFLSFNSLLLNADYTVWGEKVSLIPRLSFQCNSFIGSQRSSER